MQIVLATANAHKLREIEELLREALLDEALLDGSAIEVLSLRDFPHVVMPEETGETMRENARLKAQSCAAQIGLPCLADDSGIEVDALNGSPGVRSARWVEGSDEDRTRALLAKLQSTPQAERAARYRCAICLAFPDGKMLETEATVEGRIGYEFKGENGFGYDPIFEITPETSAPAEYIGQTMAQAPPSIKARVSHRARAVRKLRAML